MTPEFKQPTLEETMKASGKRWLECYQENKEFNEPEKQEILGDIWLVLTALYPDGRKADNSTDTTLNVPSARLVELGLVSEKAAGIIGERRTRKGETTGQIKLGNEPLNVIVIKKVNNGFQIIKSYVTEELSLGGGGSELRKDSVIEEEALLVKEGDSYQLTMKVKKAKIHLHAIGETWFPQNLPNGDSQYKEAEITPKDLVRTLVLLFEGLWG